MSDTPEQKPATNGAYGLLKAYERQARAYYAKNPPREPNLAEWQKAFGVEPETKGTKTDGP